MNHTMAKLLAIKCNKLESENDRFRAGLQIIIDAGAIHGGAWCVAQARGYLHDLDFDEHPETGKAPAVG